MNAPESTRHSAVPSEAVNVKVGSFWFVGADGPEVMLTVGAAVSMVQVRAAGVASVLPDASVARTSNVWLPAESPVYVFGEVQAVKPASWVESRRHLKVEPISSELKLKVAVVWFVGSDGPPAAIVVWGGVVSASRTGATTGAKPLAWPA